MCQAHCERNDTHLYFLNTFHFLDFLAKFCWKNHCTLSICMYHIWKKSFDSIILSIFSKKRRPAVSHGREFDWQAGRSSPAVSHVTSVINDIIDTCNAEASTTLSERDSFCCPFGVLWWIESSNGRPENILEHLWCCQGFEVLRKLCIQISPRTMVASRLVHITVTAAW